MENVTLSKTSLGWLVDAAKWSRFIAILGFIMIGFFVVVGIFIGPVLSMLNNDMNIASGVSGLSGSIIAAVYIAIAIVYFFPVYYLFQFSHGIINAYKAEDEENINASFVFLKRHYKFIGILMIVVIAIYIVIFAVSMIALLPGLF